MQDYRKLDVWHKSYEFVLDVYKSTNNFPQNEMYGLTSQFRRASVSISANISEGCGKSSNKDFVRFLNISMGSCSECEFYINLAKDLKYIDEKKANMLNKEIIQTKKMLASLIVYLRTTFTKGDLKN